MPRSPPELPPIALENLHFQRLGRYVQCNDAPDLAAEEVQEPDANDSFESPFTDDAIPSSTRLAVDDAVSDESESFDMEEGAEDLDDAEDVVVEDDELDEMEVFDAGDDDFDSFESFDECEEANAFAVGDDEIDGDSWHDFGEPYRATSPAGLDEAPQRGRGLVERAALVVFVLILIGVVGVLGLVVFKLISHYAAKS